MNSDDSDQDSPIQSLTEMANGLLPLMNSLETDMAAISAKMADKPVTWLQAPVVPLTDSLQGVWKRYDIPEKSSVHSLLNMVFENAKSVELGSRTIHFSEEDAVSFSRPSMTIYELLHLVIDSVDFCAP